jgi:hypothetical protein
MLVYGRFIGENVEMAREVRFGGEWGMFWAAVEEGDCSGILGV